MGLLLALTMGFALFLAPEAAWAASPPPNPLLNSFDLRAPMSSPGLSTPLQIILLLTAVTFLPFMLMVTTSFMRTVIVFGFLKQAMGLQQIPPGQILIGMALFLSMYTMTPVWDSMTKDAIEPYLNKQINQEQMFRKASLPLQRFMIRQTNQQELAFFLKLGRIPSVTDPDQVPLHVVVPAFMVSELATAFKIGFIIFLPFVVVDLVIASAITVLGMQSLQAQMVAPPFKILIFSLANGWHLVFEALIRSFR